MTMQVHITDGPLMGAVLHLPEQNTEAALCTLADMPAIIGAPYDLWEINERFELRQSHPKTRGIVDPWISALRKALGHDELPVRS